MLASTVILTSQDELSLISPLICFHTLCVSPEATKLAADSGDFELIKQTVHIKQMDSVTDGRSTHYANAFATVVSEVHLLKHVTLGQVEKDGLYLKSDYTSTVHR